MKQLICDFCGSRAKTYGEGECLHTTGPALSAQLYLSLKAFRSFELCDSCLSGLRTGLDGVVSNLATRRSPIADV